MEKEAIEYNPIIRLLSFLLFLICSILLVATLINISDFLFSGDLLQRILVLLIILWATKFFWNVAILRIKLDAQQGTITLRKTWGMVVLEKKEIDWWGMKATEFFFWNFYPYFMCQTYDKKITIYPLPSFTAWGWRKVIYKYQDQIYGVFNKPHNTTIIPLLYTKSITKNYWLKLFHEIVNDIWLHVSL